VELKVFEFPDATREDSICRHSSALARRRRLHGLPNLQAKLHCNQKKGEELCRSLELSVISP
jgi:hypothetical protein